MIFCIGLGLCFAYLLTEPDGGETITPELKEWYAEQIRPHKSQLREEQWMHPISERL